MAPDVMDSVPFHFQLELRVTPPTHVLSAIVRQHLFGGPIFTPAPPIHLQHIVRRLAPVHLHRRDVSGMIIDKSNQIGILPPQSKGEDIALP